MCSFPTTVEMLAEYDEWSDERSRELRSRWRSSALRVPIGDTITLGPARFPNRYPSAVRQADAIFETLIRGLTSRAS